MAVGDIVSTESVRRRGRIVPTESVLPKADETVPPGGPGLTPPRVERAPLPRAGFSFDPSVYPQSYTGPEMRAAGQGLRPPTPKETERWAQAGQEAYERGVIREAKQEQQSGLGQRFERWRLGNVYGLAPATTESRGKIGLQERWARTSEKQGYPEDESAVRAAIRTVGPVGMSWVERSRLAAADTYADPAKGKQTIAQLPDSRLAQEVNKFGGKFGETIKPEDLQRDPALRKQAEQELFEGATKIARTHIGFEQERAERGEKWYSKGLYGAVEMLPYMSNIALGRAAFTVGEGLTRYAELRAPQMIVDDAGELAVTKEGAGEIEALAKAFGGAYATHAIETIEHIPGGKWAKGKLAKHMPSGLMRKGRAIAKAVAKVKDKFPRLNAAMRAFNKATGFHGLGREIFVEEGAEAFVNALGNLQNEYEKAGVQNLPEGFMRFAKEVPDMALSMSILRGGQYAIGTPGYIAANARRHKDMKTALKAFGLSDARIRGMSVEARADKLNELWESVVTDAQAEDVATVARQAVPEIFPEQAPEFGEPGGEEAERPEPATTPATEPLAPAPGTAETSQEALTGPEPTPTPTAPEIVESERPAPSPEAGFEASMAAGAPVAAPLAEPATGTTPEATGEAVPPTPEAVADELGIEYGGFQVGTKKTPATYLFTDPVTHDSFNVADLRDAKRQLEELRAGYKVVRGKGEDIEKVVTNEIGVRPDLMQYKQVDDPRTGIREADKITGAWAYRKGGVLLLWEPENPEEYGLAPGERYIVANGHHRLAAAQEQGVDYLNAQILREADGYSAEHARIEAAEINIADGKGTIYDQANWFRNTAAMVGADGALEAGKRIGAQGRKAQTIGLQASDNVYSSFINEQITPDQAYQIAKAAPDNDAAQQVGLQRALQGLEGSHLANFIYAVKEYGAEQPDGIQLDLFGQDDAAIAAMDRQAGIATEHQQALKDQIASVRGAAKRPDLARELGVDVNDPAAVQRRIDELRQEAKRWEEWPDHPDLVAIVKGEDAAIPKQEPLPFQVEEEEETGEFVAPEELERPTPPAAVPQANVAGLDAKLEGLRERWKNGPKQIVVLATQDDAPGRIKQHAPEGGFRGAYDPVDDVVYLVADRLGDPNAGEFVVIHEVIGHRGIKAVLGEKGAREFYRGLAAARNKDVGAYAKSKGLPYKTAADRRTAAAEWLADRIAQGDFDAVKPWYEKLLALLRDALAGLTGRTFTDAELGQLVEASHRFTEGEEVKPGETGPTYLSQPEFSRAEPTEGPAREQLAEGHVIARRLFPSAKGVMGKEYRAFAERVTGKPSMADMTSAEADKFVSALRGLDYVRQRARAAGAPIPAQARQLPLKGLGDDAVAEVMEQIRFQEQKPDAKRLLSLDTLPMGELQVLARSLGIESAFKKGMDKGAVLTAVRNTIKAAQDRVLTPDQLTQYFLKHEAVGAQRGYRAGQLDLQATHTDLAEFAKTHLPAGEYKMLARVLGAVAKTRTPATVKQLIKSVNRRVAAYEQTSAMKEFWAELKEIKAATLRPEYAEQVDELLDQFALTSHSEATLRRIDSLLAAVEKDDIGEIPRRLIDRAIRVLEDQEKPLIRDQSPEDIRAITASLAALLRLNNQKGLLLFAKEKRRKADLEKAAVQEVTNRLGESYKTGPPGVTKKGSPTRQKQPSALKRLAYNLQLSFDTWANKIAGSAGRVYEVLVENTERAVESLILAREVDRDHIRGILERLEIPHEQIEQWSEVIGGKKAQATTIELPTATDEKGHRVRRVALYPSERMELLALIKDPSRREELLKNICAGIILTRDERMGAIKLRADDLRAIRDSASDKEMALVELVVQYINSEEYKQRINDVSIALDGVKAAIRDSYYPSRRKGEYRDEFGDMTLAHWQAQLAENQGIFKRRTGSTSPFVIDDFFVHMREHSNQITNYISLVLARKDAEFLVRNHEFRTAVRNGHKYGAEILRTLEQGIVDFAGMDYKRFQAQDEIVNRFIQKAHKGALAWKPWIALYQPISYAYALDVMSPKYLFAPGVLSPVNNVDTRQEIYANSPMLRARLEASAHQIITPGSRAGATLREFWGGPVDKSLRLIHQADTSVMLRLWRAAKAEGIDKGLSGQDLMNYTNKRTNEIVRLTQPTWDSISTAGLLNIARSRPLVKLMTMFSSQRNKCFNMAVRAVDEFSASNHTMRDYERIVTTFGVLSIGAVMLRLIQKGAFGLIRNFWELLGLAQKKRGETPSTWASAIADTFWGGAERMMGTWLIFGDGATLMANIVRGKQKGMFARPADNILSDAVGDITQSLAQARTAVIQFKEGNPNAPYTAVKSTERILRAVGLLTGIPFQAIDMAVRDIIPRKPKKERRTSRASGSIAADSYRVGW